MNLHHLELFYYVARHKGIVNACRHMPYGVQQPAVSAQIRSLEDDLGVTLFRRRPFTLTPEGRALFDFARPFFIGLHEVESNLRGLSASRLSLAGPSELLRFHVPDIYKEMKKQSPDLQLTVYERNQADAIEMIEAAECPIAITVREAGLPRNLRSVTLARLPLALIEPKQPRRKSSTANRLASHSPPDSPLIAPPRSQMITRLFHAGLARRAIHWPTRIEALGLDQIAAYVRHGFGTGLWTATPGVPAPPGVRVTPLEGFDHLEIHAFWSDPLPPIAQSFLEAIKARARRFEPAGN